MAKTPHRSPFLFPSTAISYPSESAPSSSSSPPPPSFNSSGSNSSFNSPYKSSSQPPLSHASSSHFTPANFGPCAACIFHNRRCSDKCYIASFLPPSEAPNFTVADSLFGSGNVVNFLQHNSNTSFVPLLLLLRDTSREDEAHSDPNNDTEINIQKQLNESVDLDPVGELIQGRGLAEQLKAHLNSETRLSDRNSEDLVQMIFSSFIKSTSTNNCCRGLISQEQNDVPPIVNANIHPSESPVDMDVSPGSVNFLETVECSALQNGNPIERHTWSKFRASKKWLESALDVGYGWMKYRQEDVLGAKYPRCYYKCIHKNPQNCWAKLIVQRLDEDPTVFEITYRQLHTCFFDGPHLPELPEEQLQITLVKFPPPANSPSLDEDLSNRIVELNLLYKLEFRE